LIRAQRNAVETSVSNATGTPFERDGDRLAAGGRGVRVPSAVQSTAPAFGSCSPPPPIVAQGRVHAVRLRFELRQDRAWRKSDSSSRESEVADGSEDLDAGQHTWRDVNRI
jgi:hypothetical protein